MKSDRSIRRRTNDNSSQTWTSRVKSHQHNCLQSAHPKAALVAHRTRQFEASLADMLENFLNHHEGQVLRVPRLVRGVTMAEFGDKYNGDINECLRGLQKERHGGEPVAIDASVRKRKWQASQDGPGPDEAESSRAVKNGVSKRLFCSDCV